MKKRVIPIALVMLIGLSACNGGALEEAEAQIADLQAENEDLYTQIEELSLELEEKSGIDSESETGISSYDTEANVETVEDVSSKVQVDGLLEYTNSYQAPNTACINLLDTATIAPSSNWSVRMDGTTSYYSHPAGVVGVIKMSNIDSEIDEIYYEDDLINPFLDALPHDGVKTSRIYVDTKYAGLTTETSITNDGEPAILKFGVFGRGTTACVYCFFYDGKKDATKSELVDTLIKSMYMEKKQVKLE